MTDQSVVLSEWKPEDIDLRKTIIVVAGAAQTGKSIVVDTLKHDPTRFPSPNVRRSDVINARASEIPVDNLQRKYGTASIAQTTCFTQVAPNMRNEIDFLILCGTQSKKTIEQLWSEYEHLFVDDRQSFEQKIVLATKNWGRAVLDVSAPCRQGLCAASVLRYKPLLL